MKANAPKKIYLYPSRLEKGKILNRWFMTRYNQDSVEYTRTDAFIDKAAVWIANRYQANGSYLNADDIEDFEKYMKGE